jgi:hypothetical protein
MLPLLAVAALGFSLEGHGQGRQLADNHEPCKAGCDAGHDASCDEQDSTGRWARSCDMHPTTSCDEDCHYSPPPPRAPWLGEHGTYPAPPPPASEPNNRLLWIGIVAVLVALSFLFCIFAGASSSSSFGHGSAIERGRYWCCCFLPSRRDDRSWYYDERKEEAVLARAAAQQEAEELSLTGELNGGDTGEPAYAVDAFGMGILPSLNHLK